MATAKRKDAALYKHPVILKLTQDEADLIHAVFGDLYSTNAPGANRERDMVSDIYDALDDMTESRSYRLNMADRGGFSGFDKRRPFADSR
jgi:hypothetical protein